MVLIFLEAAFLIYIFIFYKPPIQITMVPYAQKEISTAPIVIKDFSHYANTMKQRSLFKTQPQKEVAQQVERKSAGVIFKKLVKDLALKGILSGDTPKAIVENQSENRTYFVTVGEYIGDVKIQDIRPDKIILEYDNEKMTLFL